MEKISKHISYKEAVRSNTAKRYGIDNTPNKEQLSNMKRIANFIFEPLREGLGNLPIFISSFFRSRRLNEKVGGAFLSDHINGNAIDLDDILGYHTNAEIFWYIYYNLDFDQLIWEFGDDENPDWVHVSYRGKSRNRRRVLKTVRINEFETETYEFPKPD